MDVDAYSSHSRFSDPGSHADALAAIPIDTRILHTVTMQTILHYRAGAVAATARQWNDIDLRWVSAILDVAAERSGATPSAQRDPADRVGGCCRDHSLLAVAILRQHGIPARTRVGFADYFTPDFHHDHVVVEQWDRWDGRWRRWDPELAEGDRAFDVWDMPKGPRSPFATASEVWREHREGRIDVSTYGVDPALPELAGSSFVQRYVVTELAHRMKHEMLLWDTWDNGLDVTELVDRIADLMVRADDGDFEAEREAATLWRDRLQPGATVRTWSPSGRVGVTDLESRVTTWT